MKKDLDYIFKKIRNIKSRIGTQYPQAMKKVEQKIKSSLSEDSREEENPANTNEPQSSKSCTASDSKNPKDTKHSERKLSKECVTVNYVQMETSIENGICTNADEKPEIDAMNPVADGKTDNESTDSSDTSDT